MRRPRIPTPAVALAVAAMLAGCGSAHPSSSAPSAARARVIAAGDRICAASDAQLAPIAQRITAALRGTSPNLSSGAGALDQAHAAVEHGLTRMRALAVPASDRPTIARMLSAAAMQSNEIAALAAAIRRRDAAAIAAASDWLPLVGARYRDIAQAYGFKVCGSRIAVQP